MAAQLALGGVDWRGETFHVDRPGSGFVSVNPPFRIRNDRDELLLEAKHDVGSLADKVVLFGPSETPLFRWKSDPQVGITDRSRYILVEEDGEEPVAVMDQRKWWSGRNWTLLAPDHDVGGVLEPRGLSLRKYRVVEADGMGRCTVRSALFRYRYRVENDGLPEILKAVVLMAIPVFGVASKARGYSP